jgi:N-acetylmuramoyl-L-alanine amidase
VTSIPRPLGVPLLLLLLGAGSRPGGLGDVTEVRVWEHPEYTRVVIQLSRPAVYEAHVLEDPARLYLDIDEVWVEGAPTEPQEPDGPVVRVRAGQNSLRRARVVLELDYLGRERRTFHLHDPFRIVTDVFHDRSPGARAPTKARSFDSRPVHKVVIDPGHGGKDPGARGRKGLREKDLVLRVGRALRKQLTAKGLEVVMTRDDDTFLELEERTAIANRAGADVFVSIHANAAPNRRSNGVETYLLDTRYDSQTARVAARENGTTVDQLDDLQKILASLRLGYNERFAAPLASNAHDALVGRLRRSYKGTQDLGVKRGPFLVLFTANMPAILVEIGFVSNGSEAKRMRTQAFADAAAEGISKGILAYRDEHARRLLAGR